MDYKKIDFDKTSDEIIDFLIFFSYKLVRYFLIFYCFFYLFIPTIFDIFILKYNDWKTFAGLRAIAVVLILLILTKYYKCKKK